MGCVMEMPINTLSQPGTPFIRRLLRTESNINQIQSVTITGEREVKKTHIHIDKLLLDACLLLLSVWRPLWCFCRSRVQCLRRDTRRMRHTLISISLHRASPGCPHPLGILVLQTMNYFRRLDPVDDALNIIAVCVQGWEADVVQRSVMLLQMKRTTWNRMSAP